MNTKELFESKVSLYRRVNDKKSMKTITLDDWIHKVSDAARTQIESIRSVNKIDPKGAKAMKTMNLPCVTISGVFEDERRAQLVTYKNPVICIDIDDIPDGMTIDDLKKKVFELPYVFYVGLSARGEGVYALVCYNMKNDFLGTFNALESDFNDIGIKIDKACKDICRLRFASFDADCMEKSGEVEIYSKVKNVDYSSMYESTRVGRPQEPLYVDDYFTYQTIKYLIAYCGYRADEYQDWLMDGFRLATFGEYGHALFMYLSQVSAGFNASAAERKWSECVRTTKMNKDCLLFYYAEAKRRIGQDWKDTVRGQSRLKGVNMHMWSNVKDNKEDKLF